MFQRPNFCCSCGEKIDRIEWHLWTSRRFCELCQTEHQLDEWLPRIIGGSFLLFGLLGVGSWISRGKAADDLVYTPVSLAVQRAEKAEPLPASTPVAPEPAHRDIHKPSERPGRSESDGTRPVAVSEERGPQYSEPVFLCGAETKKGTACTRRVKGGGRCWQHVGRDAVLPQNELAVPAGK